VGGIRLNCHGRQHKHGTVDCHWKRRQGIVVVVMLRMMLMPPLLLEVGWQGAWTP
jgi:hypothetical protein